METKEKLLQTSFQCFLEHGYEKASISKITEQCNITKGAFYHHFKTKEEVFLAVMNSYFYEVEKWIREKIYSSEDMKTMIPRILDYPGYFEDMKFAANINEKHYILLLNAMRRFPEFKKKVANIYSGSMDLFCQRVREAQINGEIRKDIDADSLAVHIFSLAEGFILMVVLLDDISKIKEEGAKISAGLWDMIKR